MSFYSGDMFEREFSSFCLHSQEQKYFKDLKKKAKKRALYTLMNRKTQEKEMISPEILLKNWQPFCMCKQKFQIKPLILL